MPRVELTLVFREAKYLKSLLIGTTRQHGDTRHPAISMFK